MCVAQPHASLLCSNQTEDTRETKQFRLLQPTKWSLLRWWFLGLWWLTWDDQDFEDDNDSLEDDPDHDDDDDWLDDTGMTIGGHVHEKQGGQSSQRAPPKASTYCSMG